MIRATIIPRPGPWSPFRISSPCRGLLSVLLVLFGWGCAARQSEDEATRVAIRELHGILERYRTVRGGIPTQLDDVCRFDPQICAHKTTLERADAWGRLIVYSRTDGEYELRSAGPDGRLSTMDDVVLSSARERVIVSRFAGCYHVNGDWTPVDEKLRSQVSFENLRLNTTTTDDAVGGGYTLAGGPPAYVAGHAFWYPTDSNRITISWTTGLANEHVTLTADRAGLKGRWFVGDDARSQRVTGTIVLNRKDCPGAGPVP